MQDSAVPGGAACYRLAGQWGTTCQAGEQRRAAWRGGRWSVGPLPHGVDASSGVDRPDPIGLGLAVVVGRVVEEPAVVAGVVVPLQREGVRAERVGGVMCKVSSPERRCMNRVVQLCQKLRAILSMAWWRSEYSCSEAASCAQSAAWDKCPYTRSRTSWVPSTSRT